MFFDMLGDIFGGFFVSILYFFDNIRKMLGA